MSNRRQFVGTLGKALGAVGLLLPWSGKGALALPADLGKAASPLVLKIREAIRLAHAAEEAECRAAPHEEAETVAMVEQRHAELYALADQIPDPPSCFEHTLMRAEVAYHFVEKDADGRLIINDYDCTSGPATRLLKSVLQLGGRYNV